eukprot:jgi/Bigna1/68029/fgenesh1_pg.5_\
MALCASWGLAAGFGVIFTPLHLNIPFLLVGLGVDDAFILVTEFQRASQKGQGKTEAMRTAMRVGGMSIFITSLTDFLAFAIGSTTQLPALSAFCVYAGLGVIFDFFFQVTFFMACVSLNASRSENQRRDCICCFRAKSEPDHIPYQTPARGCCCFKCTSDVLEPNFKRYASTLVTWPCRAFICALFLIFLGLSSNGIHRMQVNFKLDWFLPADSYLNKAFKWEKDYFVSSTPFYVYIKDVDYYNRQVELNRIQTFLQTSKWIVEQSTSFWFPDFLSWCKDTTPYSNYYQNVSGIVSLTNETLFYNGLSTYINSNGSRYIRDIQFIDSSDPTRGILASRGSGQISVTEFTNSGKEKYEAMTELRSECNDAMNYNDARVFSNNFLYWEEFSLIRGELIQNILIAVAVMFIIVFVMIVQWQVVLSVALAIGATIINTLGMSYYWGVELNSVVTIFVLISIGLSVDYSAHIGHTFKESYGPPVFNAIFSTFIAILVLANSKTYIYKALLATIGGDKIEASSPTDVLEAGRC